MVVVVVLELVLCWWGVGVVLIGVLVVSVVDVGVGGVGVILVWCGVGGGVGKCGEVWIGVVWCWWC